MLDGRHSVSVAGVVVDERGRALLMQRRDNGHWEAPGGILEQGESIVAGVQREVLEETGLLVTPVGLTGVYKNIVRSIVALVFRCTVDGGVLTPSEESKAFYWATVEEVRTLANEAFAVRVVDAMAHHATVPIRHHDGVRIIG
ncbi:MULTISPECIES: NUDIX hydrolase [Actinomadura]|uniref:NUDIX hydrolase n=1 Tax=Actinomadura TaxID=1988 RepID=UPI00040B24EF|nr:MULTISPECIES: NUDIX domain-containing protein [Actinomadura]RSN64210.1 NUDIX domain-containing protein [Actinomadura sp. WAC 06369]